MPTASQVLRASPVTKPSSDDDAPVPPRQSPGPNNGSSESEDERQYMMLRHSDEEANGHHDAASSASNSGGGGRHGRGGDKTGGGGGSIGGSDDSGPHHIPKSPERTPVATGGTGPRSVSMRGRGPQGPPASSAAPVPGHPPYPQHHHHHPRQRPQPPVPLRVGGPSIFPGSDGPGQLRGSPPSYMRGVSEDANSLTPAYPYPPTGPPGPDYRQPHQEPYPYDPAALNVAPSWASIDLLAMGTFDNGEDLHSAAAVAGGYGGAVITPAQTVRKGGTSAISGYPGPGGATDNYFMYPPSSPIKAGSSPRGSPLGSPGFDGMLPPKMPSPRGSPRFEPEEDELEETTQKDPCQQGSDEEGLTAVWLPPQSTKGRVRLSTNSTSNERVLVAPSAAAEDAAVEPVATTVHVPPSAQGKAEDDVHHSPQFLPLRRQPSHAPGSGGRPPSQPTETSDAPPHHQPPLMVDASASRSTDSSESPGRSLYSGRVQLVGGGIGRHEWDGGHPGAAASSSSGGGGAHWSLVSRSRSMESGGSGRSPGRVEGGSGEWEPPRPTRQPMVPPPGRPAMVNKSVSAPGSTMAAASSRGYAASHDPYGMRPPPPHHHPGYYAGYDYYGGTKGAPPPPLPSSGTPPGHSPPLIHKSYSSQSSGGGGSPPGVPPHHNQGYPQGYPPSSYSPAERQQPPHPSSASAYPGHPGYLPKSGAAPATSGYPYPYAGYHPSQYPHHPYSPYPQPHGPRSKYPPQGGPPKSSHPGAYPGYPPHGDPPPPPPEDEDMDGPPAPHPLLKDYNPHRDSISIRPQFQNVKKTKAAKRTHPATPHHMGGPEAMIPHLLGPYPPGAGMPGFNDGMSHGPGGAMQTPRRRRRRNPTEKAAAAAAMAAAAEAALKDRNEKMARKDREDREECDDRKNAAEAAMAPHGGASPAAGAVVVEGLSGPAGATIASKFSEEELKTLGSGDDEDIPAAKRAAMASAVALRAAAGGSPLEPPKSAAEVKFDIADPPSSPVCMPSNVPAIESATLMTENDVLCGRGGGTNSQMGNRRFRALVRDFQPTYLMAKRREKPRMARSVVLIVRHRGGRFLRRDEKSGRLYEVGDEKAEAKTSQALREGLDVRATKTAANTLMGSVEASSKKRKTSPTLVSMQARTEPAAVEAAVERSAKEGRVVVGMGRAAAPPRPLPIHAPGFGNNYQGRSGPPTVTARPTRPPPPMRHGSAPHPSSRPSAQPNAAAGYYPPHYQRCDDPYYRSRYPPHHPSMVASPSTAYDYGGPSHAAPPPPSPSAHHHPPPHPTAHHYHYAGGGGGGGTAAGVYHYPGSYGGAGRYGAPSPRQTPGVLPAGSSASFSPTRGPRPPNMTPVVSRPKGIVQP
eukprot:CAMPEP_0181089288 /NCGR_PEP_ID=MMETSP1071-20121207/7223_1 /TAXON_ID=35127 /ORGANISM="Thalassiosira sp., Strain NH16" /LENGTH=1358 /DNA_ID=CAMNT_0023171227 /DNA_START=412 /DNA_END=4488 /DNA_ORIENTATION=-